MLLNFVLFFFSTGDRTRINKYIFQIDSSSETNTRALNNREFFHLIYLWECSQGYFMRQGEGQWRTEGSMVGFYFFYDFEKKNYSEKISKLLTKDKWATVGGKWRPSIFELMNWYFFKFGNLRNCFHSWRLFWNPPLPPIDLIKGKLMEKSVNFHITTSSPIIF